MKLRKALALLPAAGMIFLLVACGSGTGTTTEEASEKVAEETVGDANEKEEVTGTGEKEALLYVNGWEVPEDELALLNDDVDSAVRMKVLQQMAVEYGIIELFSYEDMLLQMEAENESRAAAAEAGEVVYGLLEYTALQYYKVLMNGYEESIKSIWMAETTEKELLAYYEEHIEDYREIGDIEATVTIRSGGKVLSTQEVSLNDSNYRTVAEENEILAAALETLEQGESYTWTDEYDMEWTVLCTGRSADTYPSFDEVRGALTQQWAGERFSEEIAGRIAASEVEDLR